MIRIATFGLLAALALGCEPKAGPSAPPPLPEGDAIPIPPMPKLGPPAAEVGPPSEAEIALNDGLGKDITPDRNAMVLLVAVVGQRPSGSRNPPEYYRRLGIPEPPDNGDYFIRWRTHAPTSKDWDKVKEAGRRPWSSADNPDIASWLKANEKPLAVVHEAVARPDYYNPVVAESNKGSVMLLNSNLGGVHAYRDIALALAARATHRTSAGDLDGAWRDILACYRLGRHVSHCATMIEALVGMAVDQAANQAGVAYLSHDTQTQDRLRNCLKDLEALPPMPGLADKLDLGERAFFLDTFHRMTTGQLGDVGKEELGQNVGQQLLASLDWTKALADGNGWYDKFIAALRLPDPPSRKKAIDAVNEEFKAVKITLPPPEQLVKEPQKSDLARLLGHTVSGQMMTNVGMVQDSHDRDEQARRNVRIVLALALHKAKKGRYPLTLAELGDLPADLFNGKPATYLPAGDGYLLYSVGVNGKDESGANDDLAVRVPVK